MNKYSKSILILLLLAIPTIVFAAVGYEEGIAELSKSIVDDAVKFRKQKVAVVDFTDLAGRVTELGRFLAEELSISLVLSGAELEIVDRTQIRRIFQEHALSFSGALNPASVKKVGKIAGVDALIAGTITDLGDSLRLTLKVLATDTGRVISAARTTIPKTGTIATLLGREVKVQIYPAESKKPKTKYKTKYKFYEDCFSVSISTANTAAHGLINLAEYGTASQSSVAYNGPADLAIDGNTDGNWHDGSVTHTSREHRAWWQVDLKETYPIKKIVIWNRTDCCGERLSNFNLIVFDDSKRTVFESIYCSKNKFFNPAMVVDMPENTNGRYVKIMLNGTNFLSLAEVEVFTKK